MLELDDLSEDVIADEESVAEMTDAVTCPPWNLKELGLPNRDEAFEDDSESGVRDLLSNSSANESWYLLIPIQSEFL